MSAFTPPKLPVEANDFERALINSCSRLSMTGPIRMWSVLQSLNHIKQNSIDGSCVECGVWRGGNLALMSKYSENLELKQPIIGFDTFEGIPQADEVDKDFLNNSANEIMRNSVKDEKIPNIHCYASLEQVKNNLNKLGINNVRLIKGAVEDTLKVIENIPKRISLLRLDTDWYESTKVELEVLYPRLQSGGILIIDDYGHYQGARKAVDEYFKGKKLWLHYIDYTCRLIIKP